MRSKTRTVRFITAKHRSITSPWTEGYGGGVKPDGLAEGARTMKFFTNKADISEIRKAREVGILDGVTTNPPLVSKVGRP
jgi:hypothetical protein